MCQTYADSFKRGRSAKNAVSQDIEVIGVESRKQSISNSAKIPKKSSPNHTSSHYADSEPVDSEDPDSIPSFPDHIKVVRPGDLSHVARFFDREDG